MYIVLPTSGALHKKPRRKGRGYANFHEKALFVKPTWRPPCGRAQQLCVLRAMLPSALLVSLLFGDSVHCEIHLFGLLRRRCNLPIGLASSQRVDQVRMAQSPYLDPKRSGTEAVRLALGPLRQDHHLLFYFIASLCLGFASFKLPGLQSGLCCAVVRRLLR
jgi:hypothetical protein